jgi:transposase
MPERTMSPTTDEDYQQIIRQQAQIIRQQQRRIAELEQRVAQLTARVEELSAQVARLSKNSSNSSKPPSSDIVKPPGQKGAKIGGQPGHARHERPPFAPDQIDRVADYRLDRCPDCGAAMRPMKRPPRTIQQAEMPDVPLTVTEHRAHAAWCPRCSKAHYAPLPPEVQEGGLVGPRLTTLMAYLKGAGHGSFSTIRGFCRDVLKLRISRGQVAKVIGKGRRGDRWPGPTRNWRRTCRSNSV